MAFKVIIKTKMWSLEKIFASMKDAWAFAEQMKQDRECSVNFERINNENNP